MGILGDILAQPVFPEEEVRKVLAQTADRVRASKDNPGAAVGRYFHGLFFPEGHPYRHSGGADELSVSRMNREEIVKFYRRMATGRNLILVAAGDFDPAAFAPLARRLAAALPAGEPLPSATPAGLRFEQPRLLLVDKPDATQTYFRIGMPGIHRRHPDRVPLLVANTLFGGRFTSLLNDALRVNAGLTYGANSLLDLDRRDWLIGLMEGVEDIPGAALAEGIRWEWETFPQYLDALGAQMAVAQALVLGDLGFRHLRAPGDEILHLRLGLGSKPLRIRLRGSDDRLGLLDARRRSSAVDEDE